MKIASLFLAFMMVALQIGLHKTVNTGKQDIYLISFYCIFLGWTLITIMAVAYN